VRKRDIILVGLTAAILSGQSGCGSFETASRTVYEDEALRVFLEADPTASSGRSVSNDHPVSLESAQVSLLLKGVEVERSPGVLKSLVFGPTREAAFSKDEIMTLAPQLKAAFAQASPKERVAFALMRSSSAQGSELTTGAVWVRGRGFHFVLNRYRSPTDRKWAGIPGPYDSAFARGRMTPPEGRPDFVVLFSLDSYVIKREPGIAAEMFASPETELVIDYQRLFADAKKAPGKTLVAVPTEDRRGAAGSSVPDVAPAGEGGMATVRALTDRVNRLETQLTDLLDIVKRLTGSLEEARRALAEKDEEIRTLQSAPGAPRRPRPLTPPE
jgi:hypothetical protein